MDWLTIGIIGCVVLLVLIFLGVHIGFALAAVGFIGLALMRGWGGAYGLYRTMAYFNTANYGLTPMPLFVFMAGLCLAGGISQSLYGSLGKWLSVFPAPYAVATAVASAVFGLLTGSSMVTAAMFTRLSLPEMLKRDYDRSFAAGCVAGTSILGMLIPPNLFAILYGILASESVGKLFIALVVPGLITLVGFMVYIVVAVKRNPALAPPEPEKYTLQEKVASLKGVWPMVVVGLIMLVGIFTGIFTVTEGASVGVFGAIIVLVAMRRFKWKDFSQAATDTVTMSCMIALILIGVTLFSRFIAMAGVTKAFANFLVSLNLGPKGVLFLFIILYLILGLFLDITGMLAVTIPILLPLQPVFGWDPIYLGSVVIYACIVGTLTPPVGLTLFGTQGAANAAGIDIKFNEIVKGVLPYVGVMAVVNLLIWWFPSLAIGFAKYM